jgi:hypothetical protein
MKFIYLVALLFVTCSVFGQVNAVSAGIQNTAMSILYAGIPTKMEPFGGKNCENIRLVGCEKAENGSYFYTATASQVGQTVSISIEEKDIKGNYKVVHTTQYYVKSTPKPVLSWGGLADGTTDSVFSQTLSVGYESNVPFGKEKDNFIVESYSIVASGLKGSLDGTGSEISELHIEALKSITKKNKVSIQVKYSGNSSGLATSMFDL